MFNTDKTWFCSGLATEAAKNIHAELEKAEQNNNHAEATRLFQKVKKYMKKRINENYFSPIEKFLKHSSGSEIRANSAFITMGINGILIELLYEIQNGYDESKDGGTVGKAYETVLPLLDSNITADLAGKFYRGIRCGIVHQGQTKEKTALTYELDAVIELNGEYYVSNPETVFHKLKKLYKEYWREISELSYSDDKSKKLIAKFGHILTHI